MRRTVLFFVTIDGQILQSVLICIDLHGQLQLNDLLAGGISFIYYEGYFSEVHTTSPDMYWSIRWLEKMTRYKNDSSQRNTIEFLQVSIVYYAFIWMIRWADFEWASALLQSKI